MVDVEVDALPVLLDAQALADADVEEFPRGDVPRHEVAVGRIALFEEIISLVLGDLLRGAGVLRLARDPNPAALAADALADQPQLVGAGDGRGMHLDELGIGVAAPAWKQRLRRCAEQAIELVDLPKISPPRRWRRSPRRPAGRDLHRHHVLGDAAAAAAWSSRIGPRKSQNSYFVTLPATLQRRTCSSRA